MDTQNQGFAINLTVEDSLLDIRKRARLSQREAARLSGFSLRSYQSYEKDESSCPKLKLLTAKEKLLEVSRIDHDKGILTLEEIKAGTVKVAKDYDIDVVILFGSYATGKASESSDVNLLVLGKIAGLAYVGFAEKLRMEIGKRTSVYVLDYSLGNRDLLKSAMRDGIRIYVGTR